MRTPARYTPVRCEINGVRCIAVPGRVPFEKFNSTQLLRIKDASIASGTGSVLVERHECKG